MKVEGFSFLDLLVSRSSRESRLILRSGVCEEVQKSEEGSLVLPASGSQRPAPEPDGELEQQQWEANGLQLRIAELRHASQLKRGWLVGASW